MNAKHGISSQIMMMCALGLAGCGISTPPQFTDTKPQARQGLVADTSRYGFESGLQGWNKNCGGPCEPGNLADWVGPGGVAGPTYAGEGSMHTHIVGVVGRQPAVATFSPAPPAAAGEYVTFHFWLPKNSASVTQLQFYIKTSGWVYNAVDVTSAVGFKNDEAGWLTAYRQYPTTATQMLSIGVDLSLRANYTADVYMDAVDYQ